MLGERSNKKVAKKYLDILPTGWAFLQKIVERIFLSPNLQTLQESLVQAGKKRYQLKKE